MTRNHQTKSYIFSVLKILFKTLKLTQLISVHLDISLAFYVLVVKRMTYKNSSLKKNISGNVIFMEKIYILPKKKI